MNKPASLRAALEAALPYLLSEPDRLLMFIEDGKIAAALGGPGFEYRYTLTIGLLDFNLHPDQVMIPLLQWIKANEPSLMQHPEHAQKAITFDAEIQNHTSYDLHLQLKLSERVKVTITGNDCTAEHLPEPQLGDYPHIERVQIHQDSELIDDSAKL